MSETELEARVTQLEEFANTQAAINEDNNRDVQSVYQRLAKAQAGVEAANTLHDQKCVGVVAAAHQKLSQIEDEIRGQEIEAVRDKIVAQVTERLIQLIKSDDVIRTILQALDGRVLTVKQASPAEARSGRTADGSPLLITKPIR
jgi:hypothetical protein